MPNLVLRYSSIASRLPIVLSMTVILSFAFDMFPEWFLTNNSVDKVLEKEIKASLSSGTSAGQTGIKHSKSVFVPLKLADVSLKVLCKRYGEKSHHFNVGSFQKSTIL